MPGQTFPQSPQWSLGKQANVTSIITPPGGVAFHERMTCIMEAGEYKVNVQFFLKANAAILLQQT